VTVLTELQRAMLLLVRRKKAPEARHVYRSDDLTSPSSDRSGM
jgi:hypothetical protein